MSDLINRQMLKADLLCGDNAEHDYCFPCKRILERIDDQPAAQQKKKNRNGRDSYGRLLANGWHLEVSRAEINVDNDNIPIVLSADIHGCDHHGSWFSQTLIPAAETHDKRTETHACDCISRQTAMDFVGSMEMCNEISAEAYQKLMNYLEELPSAQPETAKRIVGKSRGGMTLWYQCDMCNEPVDAQDNYCRGCGRRLIDE